MHLIYKIEHFNDFFLVDKIKLSTFELLNKVKT